MANPSFRYQRLSKDDAAVLLIDHQSGLISLVQDHGPAEFKDNVLALADVATFFELPTNLTTSFEDGPNGPIVPELKEEIPAGSPHRPPRPDQRLGQRGVRASGEGYRAAPACIGTGATTSRVSASSSRSTFRTIGT